MRLKIQLNSSPRLISTGLEPWVTISNPLCAIALAKTVLVVVPSPASSLVLFATSCTNLKAKSF